jgi:hypothetical protein
MRERSCKRGGTACAILSVAGVLGVVAPALAESAVELTSSYRNIFTEELMNDVVWATDSQTTNSMGAWNQSVSSGTASSSQTSLLHHEGLIQGSGSATARTDDVPMGIDLAHTATNTLKVNFSVTELVNYNLAGSLHIETEALDAGTHFTSVSLTDMAGVVLLEYYLESTSWNEDLTETFDANGVLDIGTYILTVEAYSYSYQNSPGNDMGYVGGTSAFDVAMAFSSVPSPGGLAILCLAAIGGRRRRA